MSIEYNEAVNDFNDRLKEINLLEINAINFCEKITELDAKLKASAYIRTAITNEFYHVFRRKLQASMEVALDVNTQILTKCLKNSAAAFKEDLDEGEKEICQLLIGYLNKAICSNEASLDLNVKVENGLHEGDEIDELASAQNTRHTIYQNVCQYFFNLIQDKKWIFIVSEILKFKGNTKAYDEFIAEWVSISFKLLKRPSLSMDLFNLASMLILYGCLEKPKVFDKPPVDHVLLFNEKQNLSLNDYFNILDNTFHLISTKYLNNQSSFQIDNDEELFDQLLDETIQVWPFKLCEHYFDYFYFNTNELLSSFDGLNEISNRLNLFKMLKFNIFKFMNSKSKSKIQMDKFCSLKNLNFVLKSFDLALKNLLKNIEDNFGLENENTSSLSLSNLEVFYAINDHFNEVKLLVRCLSDILTSDDNESFSKTNLDFAQKHENILANSCILFHQIHVNDRLNKFIRESTEKLNSTRSFIEAKQQKANYNTNPYFNLKCEFVRLIGILVYNNKFNQNLLANYKVLHLISNNLNIDFDNPFIREWSLVALKHILSCLDLKQ